MTRVCTVSIKAAQFLVLALFLVNVYRAATQSITVDEAYTYQNYVARPFAESVAHYYGNNHVLSSLLSKLSVWLFGVSEFTLRLPSLLCGLLYLLTAYRICRYVFEPGALFLIAVALLTLNPFVLDYTTACRGYGMGLAFWLWAFYQVLVGSWRCSAGRLYKAAVGLALAVAAQLVFVFPAVALAAVFAWMVLRESPMRVGWRLVDHFMVPGILIAFLILVLPLSRFTTESFTEGHATLAGCLDHLLKASFQHHYGAPAERFRMWIQGVVLVLTAALFLAAGLYGAALAWRRKWSRTEQCLLLASGTLWLTAAALVAERHLLGLLYPVARAAIFAVPLLVLPAMTIWKKLEPYRLFTRPAFALAGLCLGVFLLEFNVECYGNWQFDAGTKRIVKLIQGRPADHSLRIHGQGHMSLALNFYRELYHLNWEPVERTAVVKWSDYYVFLGHELPLVKKLGLEVLYIDPASHQILAK